jgi:hypothetical protein
MRSYTVDILHDLVYSTLAQLGKLSIAPRSSFVVALVILLPLRHHRHLRYYL